MGRAQEHLATVEVVAFDTRGQFLGRPVVTLFESDDHKNLAAGFRAGVAEGIPYGEYRIQGHRTAYFSESRDVRVYQKHTTVILGLAVGFEQSTVPLSLHGRVAGLQSDQQKRTFVKLAGVYSNASLESAVGPDGSFDLAGMIWGVYLLMVVGEKGILASRLIEIPYVGPPLLIETGRDAVAGDKWERAPDASTSRGPLPSQSVLR
jgi:hypothetical protein